MGFFRWFGGASRAAVRVGGDGLVRPGRDSRARDTLEAQTETPLDDEARVLVERIRAGDTSAFDTFYLTYFDRVWRFASRSLRSGDVAADVAQEVFAGVWMRRETWEPRISLDAYLFRAVRNRVISLARHAASTDAMITKVGDATPALGTHRPAPDESAESDDALERLRHAIDALTERQREAVLLLCDRDLNQVEIAAVLGVSEAAVRKLLAHARERLRPVLESMRAP
jgi:RNA polymerase sigma-70 factor (ECF subfamily)